MIYQQEIIQHWGTLANNCASPKRTEKCGRNVYGLWSHQIMHSIETAKKTWFPVYGSLEPTQFPPSSASLFFVFFGRHWSSCTPGKMGMMSVLRRWKMPRPRRLVVPVALWRFFLMGDPNINMAMFNGELNGFGWFWMVLGSPTFWKTLIVRAQKWISLMHGAWSQCWFAFCGSLNVYFLFVFLPLDSPKESKRGVKRGWGVHILLPSLKKSSFLFCFHCRLQKSLPGCQRKCKLIIRRYLRSAIGWEPQFRNLKRLEWLLLSKW